MVLRQIVRRIVETFGTTVTLNSLRQETGVSSHHATVTYIGFLRDSYVVTVIHKLDRNRNAPVVRDSRKVHFEDPFMFHALRAWALGRDPRQEALNYLSETDRIAKLIESVVANHLVRLLFNYQPSAQFDYTGQLFHWQSANQRQLDFVAWVRESYVPIEVKYQTRVSSDDAIPINRLSKGREISLRNNSHQRLLRGEGVVRANPGSSRTSSDLAGENSCSSLHQFAED